MGIFKKIFGICDTIKPSNENAWRLKDGLVEVDLSLLPELARPETGVRLEGNGIKNRILLVKDKEGEFHAFENRCTHMGRRIDLKPGENRMKCCSVSGSFFDLDGNVKAGPAKGGLKKFNLTKDENLLKIEV